MTDDQILKTRLLTTLDCITETAGHTLDDMSKEAELMREQIESLGRDGDLV